LRKQRDSKNFLFCGEKIYLDSPRPPLYVVSACPKDRLAPVTWWFPIVGRMPYLGFFDLNSARVEKKELEAKDLDVSLGSAEAYRKNDQSIKETLVFLSCLAENEGEMLEKMRIEQASD